MKYFLKIIIAVLLPVTAWSIEPKIEWPPLIAADIRHGELANGLRYFIKANKQPAAKVEMHLLVNVGSMSETEGERGLAHLLEHMAFRGTQHFAEGQVQAFVESQGMRLGDDTNAFTSAEYTLYQLGVASDQSDKALRLLADWATGGIEIDDADLFTEKNVVLEEGRQRQASDDYYTELLNVLYPKANYAQRLPIGDVKVIDTVTQAKLKAFYQREYQAQRMTLMIAGDIDVAAVETKIKTLFASAKAGTAPRDYPLPATDQGLRLFSQRNVPWLAQPVVRWTWLLPMESMADADAVLRSFQLDLLSILLRQRLIVQSQQAKSALLDVFGFNNYGELSTPHSEFGFSAEVKETKLKDGLREVYRELERAKRFGFTEAEVSAAFEVRQKQASASLSNEQWASQMLWHVRYGTSLRTLDDRAKLRQRLMAVTKPADLQQQLQRLLKDPNQVAYLLLPQQLSSFSLFSESSVKSMVAEVQAEPMFELQYQAIKPLMRQLPVAGSVVQSSKDTTKAGRWLKLSNGIELLLVAPQSSDEKIGFAALAKGGLLSVSKKQLPAARALNEYLMRAGLGELTAGELTQTLSLHSVYLTPITKVDQFGFIGKAESHRELETLLQLQYLAFTSRRQDDVRKVTTDATYQSAMINTYSVLNGLNSRRYGENWPTPDFWLKDDFDADLNGLNAVREQLLANPAEFRFVLTGVQYDDFSQQLIERYIASLPTQALKPIALPKLGQTTPSPVMQALKSDKAIRVLQLGANVTPSAESRMMTQAIAELLRMRLQYALREAAGDTYNVNVWSEFNEAQGALIDVLFQHDVAQCDATAKIVERELARLLSAPPSESEVQAVRDKIQKSITDLPQSPMLYARTKAEYWQLNQTAPLAKIPDLTDYTADTIYPFIQSWLSAERWASGAYNCHKEIDFEKIKPVIAAK